MFRRSRGSRGGGRGDGAVAKWDRVMEVAVINVDPAGRAAAAWTPRRQRLPPKRARPTGLGPLNRLIREPRLVRDTQTV